MDDYIFKPCGRMGGYVESLCPNVVLIERALVGKYADIVFVVVLYWSCSSIFNNCCAFIAVGRTQSRVLALGVSSMNGSTNKVEDTSSLNAQLVKDRALVDLEDVHVRFEVHNANSRSFQLDLLHLFGSKNPK